jgi:hypothetical protein
MNLSVFRKSIALSLVALFAIATFADGQVLVTNSLVSYTYTENTANTYVPASPLASATGQDSSLAFAPNNFSAVTTGTGMQIDSQSGILTVDIFANAGSYFTNTALSLNVDGQYQLFAPFSTSEAFASITASYTVYLSGVDGVPYSSPIALAGSVPITPTNTFSLFGPGASASGVWNGSLNLTISSLKTYFGIGPTNNITGLRLQYSSTVNAASINGSATMDQLNVTIASQVVPEPSTYALLAISALALSAVALRRRKRPNADRFFASSRSR